MFELQPTQGRPGQELVQIGRTARCPEPFELPRCDYDDGIAAIDGYPLRLPATAKRTTSLSLALASPSFQTGEGAGAGGT